MLVSRLVIEPVGGQKTRSDMSDIFTSEKRSAIMKAVKSRNTKTTELKMIEVFKEFHICRI